VVAAALKSALPAHAAKRHGSQAGAKQRCRDALQAESQRVTAIGEALCGGSSHAQGARMALRRRYIQARQQHTQKVSRAARRERGENMARHNGAAGKMAAAMVTRGVGVTRERRIHI